MLRSFTAAGFAATALISSGVLNITEAYAYSPIKADLVHAQDVELRHTDTSEFKVAAKRSRRVIRRWRAKRNGSVFSGKVQGKESLNARTLNGINPTVLTSGADKRGNIAITAGDSLEMFAAPSGQRVRVKDGRFILEPGVAPLQDAFSD